MLRNIPIFSRLALVFTAATIVPIIAIVFLGNFYLQSMNVRSQSVQTSFDAQNTATQEQINLQRMNALVQARFAQVVAQNSPSVAGDPALGASGELDNSDIAALEINFDQTLSSYQNTYEIATSPNMAVIRNILVSDTADHGQGLITTQQVALNDVAHTDWHVYRDSQDKLLADLSNPNFAFTPAYVDFYNANLNFLNLRLHWQEVVDTSTAMGTAVTQVGPSLTTPLISSTAGAIIFTLLIIVATALLINQTIVRPLRSLVMVARRISLGDYTARAETRGRDEIYQVANAINGMLDIIVRLLQETQTLHSHLQTNIEKLIHEVGGIGEGDLRKRAVVESNEIGPLASFFNIMMEELSNLVINVKTLARGVQMATLQVFGHIEQLADSTDSQAQQIQRAVAEVDTMASSSQKSAERSLTLYNQAQEAHSIVQEGRKTIRRTLDSMERINENIHTTSARVGSLGDRSREVNNILEVITTIALQTNRLALDAAVQAAMAGDNGKGFGAVAADIRRLAERAKEQTTIINQIVNDVLEDINTARHLIMTTEQESAQGTMLTRQVGSTLETIFSVLERQANAIEQANQATKQHLSSSMTVVQLMQTVSEAGQQNTMNTREATRQVERLAQLAGQLLTSVEVFKLRDNVPAMGKSAPGPQQRDGQRPPLQSLRNAPQRFRRPAETSSGQFSSGRNMNLTSSSSRSTPFPHIENTKDR